MKLRSHEILSETKSTSRFKKLFQGKNLFKKKLPITKPQPTIPTTTNSQQSGLLHGIPDYVRKSILRYLLEVWYRLIRNFMLFFLFSWVHVKNLASMTINVDTTD